MKQILFLALAISLFACSPAKRLGRLLKHHPELVRHDTVWKDTTIFIPAKEIKGDIQVDRDYSTLLSMIEEYKGTVDSLARLKIKNDIKYYITNKPILIDTVKIDSLGLHLRLFDQGGQLHYLLRMDSLNAKIHYAQEFNSVESKVQDLSFWDKYSKYLNILILILLVILLIRR